MNAMGLDLDRAERIERALLGELDEVYLWLADLEERARARERVERRVRRLRKLSARLDAHIRLIRDLRVQYQAGAS